MRLLDTSTLEICDFLGNIPHYAILSHRWEDEEVSFQDLREGKGFKMAGYSKVLRCCAQARSEGWGYVWIDSCCIDKTSSSELSEAINSMFQYYRNAQVCYAYLSDVPSGGSREARDQFIRGSKWFTRGWTLQELLAPHTVAFFSGNWVDIGTKASLAPLLQSITGIKDLTNFQNASVAQKMSWASKRQTTRVEDIAYCLLGLFNITMPLLYGEGEKAFVRLQLEILKMSDDESLFAWDDPKNGEITGMLARHPSFFERSDDIRQVIFDTKRAPYEMTNKGLRMELSIGLVSESDRRFLAPLNCARGNTQVAIILTREEYWSRTRWLRTGQLFQWRGSRAGLTKEIIIVEQRDGRAIGKSQPRWLVVQTGHMLSEGGGFYVAKRYPTAEETLDPLRDIEYLEGVFPFSIAFSLPISKGLAVALLCKKSHEENFVIYIYNLQHNLGIRILPALANQSWSNYVLNAVEYGRFASDTGHLPDRASGLLPSGKSVSAAVKRQYLSETVLFIVEIKIHMDGQMDWPCE